MVARPLLRTPEGPHASAMLASSASARSTRRIPDDLPVARRPKFTHFEPALRHRPWNDDIKQMCLLRVATNHGLAPPRPRLGRQIPPFCGPYTNSAPFEFVVAPLLVEVAPAQLATKTLPFAIVGGDHFA